MIESRVREIVDRMKSRSIVWLFPSFEEALYSGQHSRSPRGLLDALLPRVEAREIAVIAEIDPTAYELLAQQPAARDAALRGGQAGADDRRGHDRGRA